ncbi:MAG: hypothetical protein HOV81_00485 [Kofleriaceae bacterium]|nr:hypothetical protein [Kofleriaceae bacterium]
MRKLVIIAMLAFVSVPTTARAEVGIGAFLGEPTGLDVKLDLSHKTALDLLVGWYSHCCGDIDHGGYGHITYLVTPVVGRGRSVLVPLRLGIGAAIFDDDHGRFGDDINVAARLPAELGLRFRGTPLELYFEIALKLTFIDNDNDHPTVDLDGGLGLRFYF